MIVPAVSPQPATPPAKDVADRPDGDLLDIVQGLPKRSGRRAAACEALVLRGGGYLERSSGLGSDGSGYEGAADVAAPAMLPFC